MIATSVLYALCPVGLWSAGVVAARITRASASMASSRTPTLTLVRTYAVVAVAVLLLILAAYVIFTRSRASVFWAMIAGSSFLLGFAYDFVVAWNPPVKDLLFNRVPGSTSGAGTECRDRKLPRPSSNSSIVSGDYYSTYHSHEIEHLVTVQHALHQMGCQEFVYLCGDSSLDNKHWFFNPFKVKSRQMKDREFTAPAVNGYENVLTSPQRMVMDVSYHMNNIAALRFGSGKVCTIMSSIEESTIEDRKLSPTGLLVQDHFIRDTIREVDSLIVSVGGNDIALNPTVRTAVNMAMLTRSPCWMIRLGIAPGFGYFCDLFHTRIEDLVLKLIEKKAPRLCIINMIYYPSEESGGWADDTLRALGYDEDPSKLQLIIRSLFEAIKERGFRRLEARGTRVRPLALFDVLTESSDYVQRVEPSVTGGEKMAQAFMDVLFDESAAQCEQKL